MNMLLSKTPIGLDGVPAAETVLSHVDGERGELIIAGERVGDLVRKTGFEGVTARLWSGATGQPVGEAAVRAALGEARQRAFARLPDLLGITRRLSIVDGFRAAIAGLRAENGLPHPVLEMLDAIGTSERIKPWVDGALSRGERLMGFGHRIYRVRDPRADVLKGAIERLAGGGTGLPFASEVETYIREALRRKNPDRPLDTNVEFFTAILLDALTIPRQAFTPIFAVARSAGWTAHAREQQRGGRLIRPSSAYIGPMPD